MHPNADLYKAVRICDKHGAGLIANIINLDAANMAMDREREILAGLLARCTTGTNCWCHMIEDHTLSCLTIQKYMEVQWPDGPPETWRDFL
jgi:hypothetical protein